MRAAATALVCLLGVAACYEPSTCLLSCPADAGGAQNFFPIVAEVFPAEDERGVALDTILRARFTEPVLGVSPATFTVRRQGDAEPMAARVAYDDETRTAFLDPDALLEPSTIYSARVHDEVADLSGQQLVGRTTWSFTTAHDMTPPMVVMTEPADGATGVPVDGKLIATFSEQVSHVTDASFLLEDASGWVPGTIGYVSQTAVSLTPWYLAPNTTYRATLAPAITDLIGNPLVNAPVIWMFTTGPDSIAPAIVSRSPDVDDTDVGVGASVIVGFSEPVIGVSPASVTLEHAGGLVPASITYLDGLAQARLEPSAELAKNTTYTVRLSSAITDPAGNAVTGTPVSWSFTTAGVAP
jgi:hypothetical protein